MVVFHCKIKGTVDSKQCYDCFEKLWKAKYNSRVTCKKENVKFAKGEINTENNISVYKNQ